VECTEAFSRQRVKSVLDLEAKETPKRDTTASQELPLHGNFRDGDEYNQTDGSNGRITLLSNQTPGEDDVESVDNEFEGQSASELAGLALGEEINLKDFENIPKRVLSQLVKLWTPWWSEEDSSKGTLFSSNLSSKKRGNLNLLVIVICNFVLKISSSVVTIISNPSYLNHFFLYVPSFLGISKAITEIKKTAPRLNTLIRCDNLTADISYQIYGILLGTLQKLHKYSQ
jgi:hypothetical protein